MNQRFNREALVWRLLRHEHIVPFLGILRSADPADPVYLVSEWMELKRLTEYLGRRPSEDPLLYASFDRHASSDVG
jgi:serine/threonine protein kinase